MLKFGTYLGFISCISLVGLFLLSTFWDPPGAGSVEAPNTLLFILASLGNLCNLIALVSCLASWNLQGFIASLMLFTNQVFWLLMWGLIIAAHGF